jgi:DNA-binding transcriptional ArsR family regulator
MNGGLTLVPQAYSLTGICPWGHIKSMPDVFTVLAEPTRRRVLDSLREADSSVGALAQALSVSQPALSKHLKVLREAGFVSCRTVAQQRVYRLKPEPFEQLDSWLAPYRERWDRHLDALVRHLDSQE